MYVVMRGLPQDIINTDAGVIKFWKLQDSTWLLGLDIRTHDEELVKELMTRTGLKAKPMEKHLPNWYTDRVLLIQPSTIYIVSRTTSIANL